MTDHTVKAFTEKLEALAASVAQMGGMAEAQLADAIEAIAKRDTALAEGAVGGDRQIDQLQQSIEDQALKLLALRQPMAVDLRETLAAIKIASELERIGDLAKNIAKRVGALDGDFQPQQVMRGVEHMSELVLTQIKEVLDSFAHRDSAKALAVWRGDEEVDAVNNSLFRELLTYMMEDPRNITFCMHLMFCAKDIERMGDHATNIAETVYYMIEGRPITDQRPKGDTTSFPPGLLKK